MIAGPLLTAEEFIERKLDLPEGGRWTELQAGQIVTLDPPDEAHGNIVRNLAGQFAEYATRHPGGYACFELGLIVRRDPDTVYCPAISYFQSGTMFAQMDELATAEHPVLVVELATTNERRRGMAARVQDYLAWPVPLVWVCDPLQREIHVFAAGRRPRVLREPQTLTGDGVLAEFACPVVAVFAEPTWWTER